jgi:hypothetical protein
MKHVIKIFGLLFLIIIQSCGLKNQNDKASIIKKIKYDLFDKYSNDSIRDIIFNIAYNNESSAPSYIVFEAIDLNNGIVKEICCEAPFLSGAMHLELGKGDGEMSTKFIDRLILKNQGKVFEFRNIKALENISFNSYPDKEFIEKIAKQNDLDFYFKTYGKNDSIKYMHFENDTGFVQKSFAHIMFKCGIITSRDCMAGNNIWFGDPNISMP